MYLIDTNVISESRKGAGANPGVKRFFKQLQSNGDNVYLSVVTLGELRRGVEQIRHRGDKEQARRLEKWLNSVLHDYRDNILALDAQCADIWGRLRVPHAQNALDKQIAAIAYLYGLIVVTRNDKDFIPTGVETLNPFV